MPTETQERLHSFEALENDDGLSWYVNVYRADSQGTLRRETIADELTQDEAQRLVAAMAAVADRVSFMP